jgi:hypothetical protein
MRKLLLALLVLPLTARCASLVHGRYQQVPVRSTPAGAAVRVDCGDAPADAGVTPVEVSLRRGAERCAITLSKAGYAEQTVTFTRMASRAAWSNVVPGLAIGTVAAAAVAAPFDEGSASNNAMAGGIAGGTALGYLVDRRSGAAYRQLPGTVDVTLAERQR